MSDNSEITNPHDRLFRSYYKYPASAANLLRQALPPELTSRIDYDSLKNEEDTFISPSLREFMADLVFSCRLTTGDSASIYILVEHKSAPEAACAVQVLRYMTLLWEEHLTRHGARHPLPIVLPLLFYQGKTGWEAKQIDQLFPADTPFKEFIPLFRMLVYNLRNESEARLKERPADNAMLLLLKALTDTCIRRKLAECLHLLLHAEYVDQTARDIQLFLSYLERVQPELTPDILTRELRSLPQGEEIMQTFMERLSEMAFEHGVLKGMAEGKAEGKAEGARSTLVNLLYVRFEGAELQGLETKLGTIQDMSVLTRLATAVIKAESLEAFEAMVDKALNGQHENN